MKMDYDQLELMGALLYKCEGAKLRIDKRYNSGKTFYYAIEFTNSEPGLIKIFLKFMKRILKIDLKRLKCQLFLYEDMDIKKVSEKWAKIIGTNQSSFNKTIIFKTKVTRFKPNPLGTCKLRYTDKLTYLKLNEIIIKKLGSGLGLIK